MRTLLYIFALLWFVAGLALLALAMLLEPVAFLQIGQLAPTATDPHPLFGNYRTFMTLLAVAGWALVFCVPALGLAGLAALLERLDGVGKTPTLRSTAREHPAPPGKRAPAEKVEPRIGRV